MLLLLQEEKNNLEVEVSDAEKIEHSKYLLLALLPFLKRLSDEQEAERELEAKRQGISDYQYVTYDVHPVNDFYYEFNSSSYFILLLQICFFYCIPLCL